MRRSLSRRVDDLQAGSVVVVGAGLAGLSAALGLQVPGRVILLTKSALQSGSSSVWAQGGIAAAIGSGDSFDLHASDTLRTGSGLCDPEMVRLLAEDGPRRIAELIRLGTRFDSGPEGRPLLGREGAHSRARILHANGDATGAEMVRALSQAVRQSPRIEVVEHAFALDLALQKGRVRGVLARLSDGRRSFYAAPAVVLACGGIGRLYLHTTNPPESTGDGLAMAARAGARLADLEFVQFHPTALDASADPQPLLTEALRGEGAVLLDSSGHRFMAEEHPWAELAPRDVVARAIWRRLSEGNRVYLDARQAVGASFPQRFPTVFALCLQAGLDPRKDLLPVSPAAHYHIGGIAVDRCGRSSLTGLWACGETAASGVHGANRLASNSLLEALVFGRRVAEDISKSEPEPRPVVSRQLPVVCCSSGPIEDDSQRTQVLRRLMWERVGLVRDEKGLSDALELLQRWTLEDPGQGEYRNMLTVGRLLVSAALHRRESRGVHYRSDYPAPSSDWQRRVFLDLQHLPPEASAPASRPSCPSW